MEFVRKPSQRLEIEIYKGNVQVWTFCNLTFFILLHRQTDIPEANKANCKTDVTPSTDITLISNITHTTDILQTTDISQTTYIIIPTCDT